MARLEAGFARDAQWRSLEWFEQSRAKIAMDLSSKLGIAPEEFSDTPETACFHFMTLALAIGKWLDLSGRSELNMANAGPMDPMERLARSKAMEGILARLFLHSYV
jgi:hypothetical protein